ncbi:MAG: hypothetical protein KGO96_01305 [Elusimicrobia bacterium]|nr:hypothetical protein [Elusimicrobiota bacterium]MDE2237162.1 hypothetical protein [Elusimicrobiota bacterium]MDE2424532.1 hypothetical protein [Elusimicrobiota bacterium]
MISLLGNVCRAEDGAILLHAHASLGLPDFTLRGGHLFRAVIRPTCGLKLWRL